MLPHAHNSANHQHGDFNSAPNTTHANDIAHRSQSDNPKHIGELRQSLVGSHNTVGPSIRSISLPQLLAQSLCVWPLQTLSGLHLSANAALWASIYPASSLQARKSLERRIGLSSGKCRSPICRIASLPDHLQASAFTYIS